MNNWKETTLGQLVKSGFVKNHNNKRVPLSSEVRRNMSGQYPYYGAASAIDYIDDYKFNGFYLLIAEDGTVFNGKGPMLQLVNGKFWVSNHSHVLQGKDEVATKLLYYVLKNISVSPYITGAVQPKLTKENLYNITFSFSDSEFEQKGVVKMLSSLDDKIELLRKQNETLEKIAQEIFKEWFVDFKIEGKKLKLKNGVPEGWKLWKLEELVNVVNGYSYKGSELKEKSDFGLVTLKSFDKNGGFQIRGFKPFIGSPKKEHEAIVGDIVVAHTDLTQDADVLGNPAFIFDSGGFKKMYITMDLAKVISKRDKIKNAFLYFLMKTYEFKRHCVGFSNGTTVLHLSRKAIPSYEIILPDNLKLVEDFSVFANKTMNKIILNNSQIQTLSRLRDTLLPKLMSGGMRIDDSKI